MIEVGEAAPDFTLPGIENGETRDYTLSEFRGRKVVLAFYPGRQHARLHAPDVLVPRQLLEVRRAPARCCSASRRRTSTATRSGPRSTTSTFPLLADTDKTVIERYGVGAPVIGVRRSVFVVDGAGVVRFADRKLIGATFVPVDKLVPVLESIG